MIMFYMLTGVTNPAPVSKQIAVPHQLTLHPPVYGIVFFPVKSFLDLIQRIPRLPPYEMDCFVFSLHRDAYIAFIVYGKMLCFKSHEDFHQISHTRPFGISHGNMPINLIIPLLFLGKQREFCRIFRMIYHPTVFYEIRISVNTYYIIYPVQLTGKTVCHPVIYACISTICIICSHDILAAIPSGTLAKDERYADKYVKYSIFHFLSYKNHSLFPDNRHAAINEYVQANKSS